MALDTPYDPIASAGGEDEEEEKMETDQKDGGAGRTVVVGSGKPSAKSKKGDQKQTSEGMAGGSAPALLLPESLSLADGNVQLNTAIRKAVKKRKRLSHKLGWFDFKYI